MVYSDGLSRVACHVWAQAAWSGHSEHVVVRNGHGGFDAKLANATEAVLRIARATHPAQWDMAHSLRQSAASRSEADLLSAAESVESDQIMGAAPRAGKTAAGKVAAAKAAAAAGKPTAGKAAAEKPKLEGECRVA